MKILYVDQTGNLGGGELSLLEVIRNSQHDAEVVLFTDGPFRAALEELGVRVHVLSVGQAGEIRREGGLASILSAAPALLILRAHLRAKAASFDVLYANSQKAFLMSALARRRHQKLIWHLRDMLTADHFSAFMRKAAVLMGNHAASAVIVNSQATGESFIQAGGRRDKMAVVYNGVSPDPFDAVSYADAQRLRAELGIEGKFVVGAFGRLTPWKGQHILIEALSGLPDMHAIIVGEALFGEDAYAQSLHALVQSLGLSERVHFVGFRRDIPVLMKAVDVVVHSSTAPEPFGRVIVEAMLSQRPVVATRAGGALEIVEDKETGLLVAPGSVTEMAAAIRRLRVEPDFAAQIAVAGKNRACSHFSVNAMMDAIHQVLAVTKAV